MGVGSISGLPSGWLILRPPQSIVGRRNTKCRRALSPKAGGNPAEKQVPAPGPLGHDRFGATLDDSLPFRLSIAASRVVFTTSPRCSLTLDQPTHATVPGSRRECLPRPLPRDVCAGSCPSLFLRRLSCSRRAAVSRIEQRLNAQRRRTIVGKSRHPPLRNPQRRGTRGAQLVRSRRAHVRIMISLRG
jgi:hypothetical protein